MDKTTTIIGAVALVLIGGLLLFMVKGGSFSAKPTTTTTTNIDGGTTVMSAPTATTMAATGMTSAAATLHGTVNPHGANTNYWFEYSAYDLSDNTAISNTPQVTAAINTAESAVEMKVASLTRKTTYYYRIVAQNNQGIARGDVLTFTTQ